MRLTTFKIDLIQVEKKSIHLKKIKKIIQIIMQLLTIVLRIQIIHIK